MLRLESGVRKSNSTHEVRRNRDTNFGSNMKMVVCRHLVLTLSSTASTALNHIIYHAVGLNCWPCL